MTRNTARKTTTGLMLAATMTSFGILGASAIASVDARAETQRLAAPDEPLETTTVSGEITQVGASTSFLVKGSDDMTHTVTTNEKTAYTLNGEEATREEVITKGAEIQAKINADDIAVSVNRTTD